MHHFIFTENSQYKVAVLTKMSAFKKHDLIRYYIKELQFHGVPDSDVIAFTLNQDSAGKTPAALVKSYLDVLLKALDSLGTKYLFVTDATYFKALTKEKKADVHHGYVLPCKIKGYEHMNVVIGMNYQQLIYDPSQLDKLNMGLRAIADHIKGTYQVIGSNIIHYSEYPKTNQEIKAALRKLLDMPKLSADIEGFSLRFNEAGIGTIGFAWSKHEGIAFPVDYFPFDTKSPEGFWGEYRFNADVRNMLREFFRAYKGNLTWHVANYDVKVLIYQLFMNDPLDYQGMLDGLEVMTRNMDDTKLIAYLATNTTAGNVLGLKPLAHEFAGNWAKDDIKDIRLIPLDELLQYNLVDCLSTNYVREKYWPMMVRDNQLALYQGLFKDSQKVIIQTELVGMPMNPDVVKKLRIELTKKQQDYLDIMNNDPIVQKLNVVLQTSAMNAANAKLKTKQHPITVFSTPSTKHYKCFNPNSNPQLQVLLYELMGLPIISYTKEKNPATGGDVIEELCKMPITAPYKVFLEALNDYGAVTKIISGFLPAFEAALVKADGRMYLHGSFNLGGTVSGRLSSSDPNLQNLPAGSTYGKIIKEAFMAAFGWIMCGADFNSLEDYISALTSKDPNKLKVYIDKFDGHALRAANYFKTELEAEGIFIDLTNPTSVNQLKINDHPLRAESKAPTFALTYQGTWRTLVRNCGFSPEQAKAIEANYHSLYAVSDKYIADRLAQASIDGYVEVAFGLRLRTPLIAQSILGNKSTPSEAAAEGRTAGNAMGQSYGLLNNRAAVATMKRVWASEHRHSIMPIALIHDAIYFICKNDVKVIKWLNDVLIEEMRWQELPEIQHPTVKLGAALDLFWPSWATPLTLKNEATEDEIKQACIKHKYDLEHPEEKKK